MAYTNHLELYAPYHFVPQSKWIFTPPWSHLVSHDVPFEDGISGEIKLKIKALSPICVGGDVSEGNIKWQTNHRDEQIIPGSSIKGLLRSVCQIATFSKMQFVDADKHFSYRDFDQAFYNNAIVQNTSVAAGYINQDETGKWHFTPCQYVKIRHDVLCKYLGISEFEHDISMQEKYKRVNVACKKKGIDPNNLGFAIQKIKVKNNSRGCKDRADFAQRTTSGGHLVFSGPVPACGNDKSKRFDYIYYGTTNSQIKCQDLDKHVNDFLSLETMTNLDIDKIVRPEKYADSDKINDQIKVWKQHPHPKLGYPVFISYEKGGSNKGNIVALGQTQLPKIRYKNSIKQMGVTEFIDDKKIDFTDCLFGHIQSDVGEMSLKSRLGFTDATHISNTQISSFNTIKLALSSPSPTFFSGYLQQEKNKPLNDYNSTSHINGWKRYPARLSEIQSQPDVADNMLSILHTLPTGSEFSMSIMVHNIKRQELGALLWALQLGTEPKEHLAHNLGHGKGYGLGVCKFEIEDTNLLDTQYAKFNDVNQCIHEFVAEMNAAYPSKSSQENNNWEQSPQIQTLQSFADYVENSKRKELQYMGLQSSNGVPGYSEKTKGALFEWRKTADSDSDVLMRSEDIEVNVRENHCVGRNTALLSNNEIEQYRPEPISAWHAYADDPKWAELIRFFESKELGFKNNQCSFLYNGIKTLLAEESFDQQLAQCMLDEFEHEEVKKTLKVKNKPRAKERKELKAALIERMS